MKKLVIYDKENGSFETRLMIKFYLYNSYGDEYSYLIDMNRMFYLPHERNLTGSTIWPIDLEDHIEYNDQTSVIWHNEIKPQLEAIRDMSEEEFVLFKLKFG